MGKIHALAYIVRHNRINERIWNFATANPTSHESNTLTRECITNWSLTNVKITTLADISWSNALAGFLSELKALKYINACLQVWTVSSSVNSS